MEVDTGRFCAAASAPAFDPNLFVRGTSEELAALLADKSHPLFDRVCRMAIPPGSTFKVLTAVALLESAAVSPEEPFSCQGYLHQPDRQRCEIYVRQGVGHGEVDAGRRLGRKLQRVLLPLCRPDGAAAAGGLGRAVRLRPADGHRPAGRGGRHAALPGEHPPTRRPRVADRRHAGDGRSVKARSPPRRCRCLRMMAAVANGGRLVTPHVAEQGVEGRRADAVPPATAPTDSRPACENAASHPRGAAPRGGRSRRHRARHGVSSSRSPSPARRAPPKPGGDRASHAWFAGYVPADEPKLAFVVVLEHAGEASTAVGPLAKRLVLRMKDLGML